MNDDEEVKLGSKIRQMVRDIREIISKEPDDIVVMCALINIYISYHLKKGCSRHQLVEAVATAWDVTIKE